MPFLLFGLKAHISFLNIELYAERPTFILFNKIVDDNQGIFSN